MSNSAQIIQLALAPVFLLVAIGTMLNVVSSRLARVIDRSRLLVEELATGSGWLPVAEKQREIVALRRRMRFANLATGFLAAAAVCVCIVVVLLFLGNLLQRDLDLAVAGLFMLTMLLFTGGILSFLLEVTIATATLKIRREIAEQARESLPARAPP